MAKDKRDEQEPEIVVRHIPADADGRMIGQPMPVVMMSRKELERRYPHS